MATLFDSLVNPPPEEEEEPELPEDSRSLAVAKNIKHLDREYDLLMSCEPKMRDTYSRVTAIGDTFTWFMLIVIFFTKPLWCDIKGDGINDTCTEDSDGKQYNMSFIPVFEGSVTFIITFLVMFIVVVCQGIRATSTGVKSIMTKFIVEMVIFVIVTIMILLTVATNT